MIIQRDLYISELLNKRWNGKVKIITGIEEDGIMYVGVIPFLMEETGRII